MSIIDNFQLRKSIPQEEFDYQILTSVLSGYEAVPQKINELLKSGVIVRVKKGLYVFGPKYNNAPVCKEVLANQIYGPSCISMEYALAFYGLIPERVEVLTSVTPKRDKQFSTPLGHFSYRYLGIDKYPHGVEQVWLDSTHPILIASPEKALCDYIALNKIAGISDCSEAMQFLEEDLRIERESWSKFNAKTLSQLNRHYRNKEIDLIVEAL